MATPPRRLKSRPWTGSELVLLPGAPTRHALAGGDWIRPHRGVVVWANQDLTAPALRIMAAAQALPGVALGGWAAAFLHRAHDLDGGRGDGRLLPVVFCPGRSGTKRPRPGLTALRSSLSKSDVVVSGGISCTSPARTAFDLARTAESLHDAVADVDCLLRVRPTVLTVDELAAYVRDHAGFRGIEQARACVALASPESRSRPESKLRVVWVKDAGLPKPLVNRKVFAQETGRLLGLPDLLELETGLVGEYDGAHHRDLRQHSDDNVREEAFEDAGLTVVRATARDLHRRPELVLRLRKGYQRATRHDSRRWYLGP